MPNPKTTALSFSGDEPIDTAKPGEALYDPDRKFRDDILLSRVSTPRRWLTRSGRDWTRWRTWPTQ